MPAVAEGRGAPCPRSGAALSFHAAPAPAPAERGPAGHGRTAPHRAAPGGGCRFPQPPGPAARGGAAATILSAASPGTKEDEKPPVFKTQPRLTSRRREAPQPRRNSRMLLRHSPSVRGSGYTCKRRGGGSARGGDGTAPQRSGVPHPAAPLTSLSLRKQRRRSLPLEGLNREVNTEHRKWRARAGGGGQERGQGCPGRARSRAALPRRGGRRQAGRHGGRRGPARPSPAPPRLRAGAARASPRRVRNCSNC